MKIAYLIHWNEGPESGVFKKVLSQASAWRALGHDVSLFLFSRRANRSWAEAEAAGISVICETYSGRRGRMARFKALAARLRAWLPDVIYHRFDLYYASLPSLLKEFPSVLEINTNDVKELALERRGMSLLRYIYHRLTRGWVLGAADGIVFVSHELAEAKVFQRYARRAAVIGNGIELAAFASPGAELGEPAVRPAVADPAAPLRLVFIGSPGQPWQGLDEIACWAKAKPEWRFDIIGPGKDELDYRLATDCPNLYFHGVLTRSEYQTLLDRADLAIGTLALYRKGMDEASPLKVREYLANGLPVIAAYRDTDFPQPVPFILELPNEPGSTVLYRREIERFAASWKGRRVGRELVQHLDVTVKETARVVYMEGIRQQRRSGLTVSTGWD